MKCFFAGLTVLVLLAGCGQPGQPDPRVIAALTARPFSAQAALTWHGGDYEADIERAMEGMTVGISKCTITILIKNMDNATAFDLPAELK